MVFYEQTNKCTMTSYDLGLNFTTQFHSSKEYAVRKNKNNDKYFLTK